jgi:hypothetical protein
MRLTSVGRNWRRLAILGFSIGTSLLSGCTRTELEHKADAYNQAIAESNNRQILLNAIRASQRAPMSFVGFGDVSASPNFSGSASSTFNFDPFGLTSYNANPSVNVAGGFSTFTMNNLNNAEFAQRLQRHISPADVAYFVALRFPKELVQLIFIQEYTMSARQRQKIESDVSARCASRPDSRTIQFCEQLSRDRTDFDAAGCNSIPETGGIVTILNTARDRCSMTQFQTFERQLRLLNLSLPFTTRTGQGVLYYLGELIAAQNYSPYLFTPQLFTATADGQRRLVPVFEVKRGTPAPGEAAVTVSYNGEGFYIPKPAFGTLEEARTLQVLDLVSQIITRATAKDALPHSSTVTLVPVR